MFSINETIIIFFLLFISFHLHYSNVNPLNFYFYNQSKGTVKELGAEAEIESVDGKMVTIRIFGNNGQTHTKYEVDRVTGIGKDIDKEFNIDLWEYEGWLRQ